MKNVAVFTNIMPEYRRGFLQELKKHQDLQIEFFVQQSLKGIEHKTISNEENLCTLRHVRHITFGRNKLVWQFLPLLKILKNYDVYVFTGNPRVISSVLLSILLRLLGKPTVVWGHVKTASSRRITQKLRLLWWGIFPVILTYTQHERRQLKAKKSKGTVISINNGVNYWQIQKSMMDLNIKINTRDRYENKVLLVCCRLIEKNNIDILLTSFKRIQDKYPNITCDIIGDGPMMNNLRQLCKAHDIENCVSFHGAIFDENELAPIFSRATFLVHPGALGLSGLHSLCYSLPVITHDNADSHMPEFTVLENGVNSLLYKEHQGLEYGLRRALSVDYETYDGIVQQCKERVRMEYNTNIMAKNFREAIYAA